MISHAAEVLPPTLVGTEAIVAKWQGKRHLVIVFNMRTLVPIGMLHQTQRYEHARSVTSISPAKSMPLCQILFFDS